MKPESCTGASHARWFCMGGGSGLRNAEGRREHGGGWREAAAFPPAGARPTDFHLTEDFALVTTPVTRGRISFQTDPGNPVPSMGGAITSGEPVMEGGAFDQVPNAGTFGALPPFLPLAARRDVLSFATAPLEHDLEIAGPVTLHLRLETDAPDIDVTLKLIDWAPPNADWPKGFAMNLTDGILRLRYRHGWDRPEPIRPGERAEITVEAPPVANLFRRGHRIRLDIAGSNFPRYDVNPQSGEPEGHGLCRRIATTTLHLGGIGHGRLTLHVVN